MLYSNWFLIRWLFSLLSASWWHRCWIISNCLFLHAAATDDDDYNNNNNEHDYDTNYNKNHESGKVWLTMYFLTNGISISSRC